MKSNYLDTMVLDDHYREFPESLKFDALKIYLVEGQNFIDLLKETSIESEEIQRSFHSLKTMSAMIGASEMANICFDFEQSTEIGEKTKVLNQAFGLWELTRAHVENYLREISE